MTNPAVSMIQTGLRDLGYQPGIIDGIFGAKTRAAAEAWLAAKGAPLSSIVTPETQSMIFQGAARYPVTEIVVHCSATKPAWLEREGFLTQVEIIRQWHVEDNHWRDIGYHWLIGRNGEIAAGRPETEIGAGVEGHNRGVIHICLIGGFGSTEHDAFEANFTHAQETRLVAQLEAISMRTRITRISGHNEWAAKACPGFNVPAWLKGA